MKYLAIIISLAYASGLLAVWVYDYKLQRMFRAAKEHSQFIEGLGLSMAVVYARKYKIERDYSRYCEDLERKRQFILENLWLVKRSSLKIEKKADLC